MRMFCLWIFILFSVVPRAQADTAIEVFKREFIERYLEKFYRGEPFDFEGFSCKGNPDVDEATSCVNAKGLAVIGVKNIDRRSKGSPANFSAVGTVVSDAPVLPEFDWSVRSNADMDALLDKMTDWAKSKPATTTGELCPKPKDYDSRGLKEVRKSIFNIVSPTGERGYLIGVIYSTSTGNMTLLGFMRGEGFCD